MRQNSRIKQTYQPLKSPDIDRSHSKPLKKTIAPIAQIISQTSPFKLNIGNSCKNHRGYSQSDRTNINYDQGSVELWRNKYQYVKRDNELLQNQIIFLNQHINQLVCIRKKQQQDFITKLDEFSKLFMKQLVGCQQSIQGFLNSLCTRVNQITNTADSLKQRLKNKEYTKNKHQRIINKHFNYQFQQLFQLKIQNTKLITRIKILEEEIKQLGNKYTTNYQWKNYSFNIANQLENKILNRVFSSSTKTENLGFTSHSSHCLDKQNQKMCYLE